jgi:RNA 3'-terminal phosphate cyclase (ATP)
MLEIDGSFGEGGGQILRSSLALSMVTGKPFRIDKIRAGRKKPGLMRQHLTAVQAAARVCSAQVDGAALHSGSVVFRPQAIVPGEYHFAIGTAGSTTLVLQTILPALLCAAGPSQLVLDGGTHNPFAPPYDFLERAFLPLINRLGPTVTSKLERYGFAPCGGGRFQVHVTPAPSGKLKGFDLLKRGEIITRKATALLSNLPRHIGERELGIVRRKLGWSDSALDLVELREARGPGNALLIEIASEHATDFFTGFGSQGIRAEAVADEAVRDARRYLQAEVPVGEYLADQLLLPLAMAGQGQFATLPLSRHSTTHLDLIGKFLEIIVATEEISKEACVVRMG